MSDVVYRLNVNEDGVVFIEHARLSHALDWLARRLPVANEGVVVVGEKRGRIRRDRTGYRTPEAWHPKSSAWTRKKQLVQDVYDLIGVMDVDAPWRELVDDVTLANTLLDRVALNAAH